MLTGTKERVSRYLRLLIRCEEAVETYYRACADVWPREAAFWQVLADEEADHAVRLEMIQERIRRTPHGVGLLHPFPEGTLQTFVASVAAETERVRAGTMGTGAALAYARDLEKSLIGSQPLRGVCFDDPRFAGYRRELAEEISRLAERIAARMREGTPEPARAA